MCSWRTAITATVPMLFLSVLALVQELDMVALALELGLAQGLERELAQGLALFALGPLGGLGLEWELAQAMDMAGLVVVGLGPATVLG